MPPEETPDFDNMSPEELMAWMETLAERQGAEEGFTTDKRMEIAEVDPNTVQDTGPGYIPYGMSEEEWAEKKAREDAEKQARIAARQQQQAQAPPPAPAPTPEPVVAEPAAAAELDFDNMSPEELMAWMETLAERQGAEEGFTTDKRMEIAEVDPNTVQDTGPGYIPYGMSEEEWAEKKAREDAEKQARIAARQQQQAPAPPPAPAPTPEPEPEPIAPEPVAAEPEPEAVSGMDWLESLAADQSAGFPEMDLSGLGDELANLDLGGLEEAAPAAEDPMSWLENMAQEQGVTATPIEDEDVDEPTEQLAMSELFDQADAEIAATGGEDVDPLTWLESLAARQPDAPDAEEFITDADMQIPLPDDMDETQAPGYQDFEFEAPDISDSVELPDFITEIDELDGADADDPGAWLDSLATSRGQTGKLTPPPELDAEPETESELEDESEEVTEDDKDVLQKLNQGISDPSDMENWMSALLDRGATREDAPPDYIEEDEEEVAIEAQIPDWLIEQVGQPPELSADAVTTVEEPASELKEEAVDLPPGLDDLADTPDEAEIPDWLLDGIAEAEAPSPEDIFASITDDEPEIVEVTADISLDEMAATPEIELDTSDPWVEAFEVERTQEGVPEWYTKAIHDTKDDIPVVTPTDAEEPLESEPTAAALEPANLAEETDLPMGQPEALPAWMSEAAALVESAAPTPAASVSSVSVEPIVELESADMSWLDSMTDEDTGQLAVSDEELPDWLKEEIEGAGDASGDDYSWLETAGIDKSDTVPDWLIETVSDTEETPAVTPGTPVPVQPAAPAPVPQPVAPTPPPANVDVAATLKSARDHVQANNVSEALADYELLIRVNAEVSTIVGEMAELIKKEPYKSAAAAYRILGDGLMRQGQLQQALDTYRKALNLL